MLSLAVGSPYLPSTSLSSSHQHNKRLSLALGRTWDRLKVLGDGNGYGHTGLIFQLPATYLSLTTVGSCVNALSWAQNGDVLLSGGDDRT